MSTETIQIVIAESGATEAAAGIKSVGEAAAGSDAALSDLLARSGTSSAAMSAITSASGAAGAALQQMTAGATGATAALVGAGQEAQAASSRISGVGASSETAAAGMAAAGTAGAALVASFREAAVASQAVALSETEVAAAATKEAAAHAAAATRATAHGAALHHLGEEGGVLQNKLERLELTFIALGLALGGKELIELTDIYANMTNQLERIKVSAADFAAKQDDIFRIAQASRQPLEAVNSVYVNMSMALRETTISATQVSTAVKTLTDAATVSGKSISETKSALDRLGISLREGQVNGRGFLQFLVQMPEIGERVAVALGFVGAKGFDNFVKSANAGAITTEQFVRAIVKVGPEMETQMKKMEVTVASAFVVVKNSFLDYIGRADSAAGASHHVADAVLALGDHIHAVIGIIAALTLGLFAYGVAVGTAALVTGALAFSFASIVGLLAVAATAIIFFGNQVKLTSDGSVTAFSLIAGVVRTVISVLGDLITWMTQTTSGAVVLGGVLGTLGIILARLAFETVVASLRSLALGFLGLLPAIAATVLALGALIATYLLVRYATVALSQGISAANADLLAMKDTVVKTALDIKTQFAQSISDTSGPLNKLQEDIHNTASEADKSLPSIVRFGQGATASFKDLSKAGNDAAVDIVRGTGRMTGAMQKLGTDVGGAATSIEGSMTGIAGSTGQAVDALGRVGTAGMNAANMVRNAMGQMVQAESDWAARSGAYFNSVSNQAASTAASISRMSSSSFSGMGSSSNVSSSALGAEGFSSGWGISDVSRGSTFGISDLSQQIGRQQAGFATGGSFEVGGSGGTDSKLVQFMATPGERVTVETPGQQARGNGGNNGGNQRPISLSMTIVTPDANSFRENENQIMLRLQNRLRTVQNKLGSA